MREATKIRIRYSPAASGEAVLGDGSEGGVAKVITVDTEGLLLLCEVYG